MNTKNKEFTTINPTTEKVIKKYSYISDDKAKKSVENCHKAFEKWRLVSINERVKIIKAIGKQLRSEKEPLAALMTEEMGKLLKHGLQD